MHVKVHLQLDGTGYVMEMHLIYKTQTATFTVQSRMYWNHAHYRYIISLILLHQ